MRHGRGENLGAAIGMPSCLPFCWGMDRWTHIQCLKNRHSSFSPRIALRENVLNKRNGLSSLILSGFSNRTNPNCFFAHNQNPVRVRNHHSLHWFDVPNGY